MPARRGLILPLGWQVKEGITVDFATAEITEVLDDGEEIVLKTEPADFCAGLTLDGYTCDQPALVRQVEGKQKAKVYGRGGLISLRRI
jgi:hypothetical protein